MFYLQRCLTFITESYIALHLYICMTFKHVYKTFHFR